MLRHSPPPSHSANSESSQKSGRSPVAYGQESAEKEASSFPLDLIRFSIRAEARKKKKSYQFSLNHLENLHAAPLISINQRDVQTLDDLFQRTDIKEIAEDINFALKRFLPTPCWEDDPFEIAKLLMEG